MVALGRMASQQLKSDNMKLDEPGGTRGASVADLPEVVRDLWRPGDRKIARCLAASAFL